LVVHLSSSKPSSSIIFPSFSQYFSGFCWSEDFNDQHWPWNLDSSTIGPCHQAKSLVQQIQERSELGRGGHGG
jgi:hypothetical protein